MASQPHPKRLKIAIGYRLFAAVLLCFAIVGGVAVQLVRWQLFDNFAEHPTRRDAALLEPLAASLLAQYRQHDGWSFLPVDAAQRKTWLQQQWLRTPPAPGAGSSAAPPSPTIGYRLALSDANRQPLAGSFAHPLLVALASIDRFEHPLAIDGRTVGHLVLAQPGNPADELAVSFLLEQQHHLGVIALVSLVLSVLTAALLAMHFRRPIRQMLVNVQQMAAGRFDIRLPSRRSDELGQLARAVNQLAARLAEIEISRQHWVANTSHELRTPLSVLRGQLEALQDGVRSATPENLGLMQQQVLGLVRLVDDLTQLSQPTLAGLQYDKQPVDIWQLAEQQCAAYADKASAAGLDLQLAVPPPEQPLRVLGDALRLKQLLGNLLENSIRYTAAGGWILIANEVSGHQLKLSIVDSAPGVPEQDLARLGERFFRVDPSRSRDTGGSGLGLALCRQLAQAHGGELVFDASPLGGLKVTLHLPLMT